MSTEIVRKQLPGQMFIMPEGQPHSGSLVKFTKQGAVVAVKTTIKLNRQAGHMYELPRKLPNGKWGKKSMISAAGYDYINHGLGVTFFSPDYVIGEDGNKHCNPYVVRDDFDNVKRIKIRMVGIGRNAAGNWLAHDSTLFYDLAPMLAQDVLKAWQYKKTDTPKEWGTLYPAESVPTAAINDPQIKLFGIPGGWVLAAEVCNEVIAITKEHSNRVRFASRNAETIVRRNLLKRFAARAELDETEQVTVIAWPQVDRDAIKEIVDMVDKARAGELVFDGTPLEIDTSTDDLSDAESEAAVLAGETDEDSIVDEPSNVANVLSFRAELIKKYEALEPEERAGMLESCNMTMDEFKWTDNMKLLSMLDDALTERNEPA